MTLTQLNQNLRRYANGKAIEHQIGVFLKDNPHIIMRYQEDQLFEESVGADNVPLGYYSAMSEKINPLKKRGDEFTMIDTGDFMQGLYIEISGNRRIIVEIGSRSENLRKMLTNKSFQTTEFFGLTEQNTINVKITLGRMAEKWIIDGITKGK